MNISVNEQDLKSHDTVLKNEKSPMIGDSPIQGIKLFERQNVLVGLL